MKLTNPNNDFYKVVVGDNFGLPTTVTILPDHKSVNRISIAIFAECWLDDTRCSASIASDSIEKDSKKKRQQ